VQRYGPRPGEAIELEPAVKAWLDNVIVPALVREVLASREETSLVLSETSSNEVAYITGDQEKEDTP
jgi:hypothetical protein